jgi:hypothetical protein
MKIFHKPAFAAVAASLLFVSAAQAASRNSSNLLQYIPADTPYVIASTEPMPTKLLDKLEPTADEVLKAYQRVMRQLMAEQLVKMAEDENGADDAEQFRNVVEEFLGLMSIEGLRKAGIERDSAFALYGNGLLPVLRFELSDDALFDATVDRFEEKAETPLGIGEADGNAYKFVDLEDVHFIIATLDEQAIMTIVPSSFDESQVAAVLGVTKPKSSLAKSKALRKISKEYGLSNHMTGYFDIQRIVEAFTGSASDRDREVFAALDYTQPELSDICRSEIGQMAAIAPRMVFGYSKVSADMLESLMVIELRDDLATSLATVPSAVPGLGSDPGGFMSFGVGLNVLALRNFYEARLDAMEANPYECELFADLQSGVAKGREALNQPVPPVVYSFRGFVANITDIKGLDMATDAPPESIDASLLIAIENAESLIAMAAMMDPQIAAMNLVADGKPVRLELAQLAEVADDVFAALSADSVAVSIGEGAESNSASMLLADSVSPAPFLSMSMDSARYYNMMGEAMAQDIQEESGEPMSKAMRDAMSDIMRLSGSMYERMTVDVRFTERGVEIGGRMLLSD